jgi:hypothetical protein
LSMSSINWMINSISFAFQYFSKCVCVIKKLIEYP